MDVPPVFALFLVFLLAISGCSPAAPPPAQIPAPSIPVSLPAAGGSSAVAITPAPPGDPIVGTWVCHSYLASGVLEKRYTFRENNTWSRTNTNLNSRSRAYSRGTWRKESDTRYLFTSQVSGNTATFQYNRSSDTFFEPVFREVFHRVPDADSSFHAPAVNLTLNAAQSVSQLQGAHPQYGNRFLIVNITVKNTHETGGYSLDEKSIRVSYDEGVGSYAITGLEGKSENPFPFGTIAVGETRQGVVIFGIPEESHSFTLRLIDSHGDDVSNIIESGDIAPAPPG